MEIRELTGTPIDIAPTVVQNLEVQTPKLVAAQTIHRHRVTTGRRARGFADGKCNDSNDLTQPSVVYNGNYIYYIYCRHFHIYSSIPKTHTISYYRWCHLGISSSTT